MSRDIAEGAPAPRLCHLRRRSDYHGYGFNLQTDDTREGQYIGKVEVGSPAELAGLQEGDRIIEVNGVDASSETHQEVVARIRSREDEVVFLVVGREAEKFYKERNIKVDGSMTNELKLETPLKERDTACHPHKARLCHLKGWSDFAGYGFNLHVDKDSLLHYIGKVDEGSPAQHAGLRENDIVIEVNDKNVQSSSHADVVKIIREVPSGVTMLVLDTEGNEHFKRNNVAVSRSSEFVEEIFCPDVNPASVKTEAATKADEPRHPFRLRLCNIKSFGDGKGFGFNMQSEKNKPGQYIIKVDEGSPADLAGLREGDFLIEVNGIRIEGFEHSQVVELIKADLTETKLLVAGPKAKSYFDSKNIKMSRDLDCIDVLSSVKPPDSPVSQELPRTKKENKENVTSDNQKKELILDVKTIPNTYLNQTSPASPQFSPNIIGGVEFAPTAEEARRRMVRKKQANNEMSLKAKYELFQKM